MKTIDLTPIIQALLALIGALITYRLIPYLKSKTTKNKQEILLTAAEIGVKAAEQIYKHGENADKIKYAVEFAEIYLLNQGYKVDFSTIRATAESICNQMKNNKEPKMIEGSAE